MSDPNKHISMVHGYPGEREVFATFLPRAGRTIFVVLVLAQGTSSVFGLHHSGLEKMDAARLFITGSVPANITEAPFVVALVAFDKCPNLECTLQNLEPHPFCSGSIITADWILSAAHCMRRLVPAIFFQVVAGCDEAKNADYEAGFWPGGVWNCTGNSGISRQVRNVSDWKIHPQYQWETERPNTFDVLLVKVDRPFNFGNAVSSIGLWVKKWEGISVDSKKRRVSAARCTAYGWGLISPSSPVTITLRAANFTVVQGDCPCFSVESSRDMFCAGGIVRNESNLCIGDGGGPLVCENLLAGVAYSSFKCSGGFLLPDYCGPDVQSAWIYICSRLSWIHQVVPTVPPAPPGCGSKSSLTSPFHSVIGFLLALLT